MRVFFFLLVSLSVSAQDVIMSKEKYLNLLEELQSYKDRPVAQNVIKEIYIYPDDYDSLLGEISKLKTEIANFEEKVALLIENNNKLYLKTKKMEGTIVELKRRKTLRKKKYF